MPVARVVTRAAGTAMVLAVATACLPAQEPAGDPAVAVELVAVREVLRNYRPAVLTLDDEYVRPGHAPPPGTGRRRPAARQRALVDSLARDATASRGDTLRIRTSAPEFREGRATVDVTVDGRLAGGHPGTFYETVALVLERVGSGWVVRRRTQLGIS